MTPLLEADHISVDFGTVLAVDDISFTLHGGELLGLIGPNGAGKTTLIRVLAGLQIPTGGQARVMGLSVIGENRIVRHQIGFAPDAPPAYEELTIRQYLQFIGGAYRLSEGETQERIEFWLEQLWLSDKGDTLIKQLSRGMRQRVTLARTFIPQPHVILLDEPLSGLDPKGRIQLRQVLTSLRAQGCAMIVSSHILSDLEEVATHIAIIERGRLLKWSRTDAIHGERPHRTYRVTTLTAERDYTEVLVQLDGLSAVSREGRVYTFEYDADEIRACALHRMIIEAQVPVLYFEVVRESLEQAYLRAGVRQVD